MGQRKGTDIPGQYIFLELLFSENNASPKHQLFMNKEQPSFQLCDNAVIMFLNGLCGLRGGRIFSTKFI